MAYAERGSGEVVYLDRLVVGSWVLRTSETIPEGQREETANDEDKEIYPLKWVFFPSECWRGCHVGSSRELNEAVGIFL